jgi:hypothetical protein
MTFPSPFEPHHFSPTIAGGAPRRQCRISSRVWLSLACKWIVSSSIARPGVEHVDDMGRGESNNSPQQECLPGYAGEGRAQAATRRFGATDFI